MKDFEIFRGQTNGRLELRFTGKEPVTVKQGFAISLRKWRIMLEHSKRGESMEAGGTKTCGLCMLFVKDACAECPVKMASGQRYCNGTPNEDYANTIDGSPEEVAAIKAEIKFLKNLE